MHRLNALIHNILKLGWNFNAPQKNILLCLKNCEQFAKCIFIFIGLDHILIYLYKVIVCRNYKK